MFFSDIFHAGGLASFQTADENFAELKFNCEKSKSGFAFWNYRYAFYSWEKMVPFAPKVQHFPASDFYVSIF